MAFDADQIKPKGLTLGVERLLVLGPLVAVVLEYSY